MDYASIIGYYKDCYRADTRTLTLSNIFGSKVEHVHWFQGREELLSGEMPCVPIPEKKAKEVLKTLAVYRLEKTLYYCSFFVLGKGTNAFGKKSKICAPLLLYPAKIEERDGNYFFSVDLKDRHINSNFLNTLKKEEADDLWERLSQELPLGPFDQHASLALQNFAEQHLKEVDASALLSYPELITKQQVVDELEEINGYRLLPASAFGVLRNSTATQGIIGELELLEAQKDVSAPLKNLFGETAPVSASVLSGMVPANLSPAQSSILEGANRHALSVVVGPPGTGKSFTIASLAVEHLSRGKTTLIACRTDQAVDVVAKKLSEDFGLGQAIVRAGRSSYLKDLKLKLSNLLGGISSKSSNDFSRVKHRLNQLQKRKAHLERKIQSALVSERDWSVHLQEQESFGGLWFSWWKKVVQWRLQKNVTLVELSEQYAQVQKQLPALVAQVLQAKQDERVKKLLRKKRQDFVHFLNGIKATNSSKQEESFSQVNFETLFEAFPIWLCKLSDLYDVLPLHKELFDLVVIDEATQCDVASGLSAMHRAKKAVVVGDPKQLRHVSFLTQAYQKDLQKKHGLEEEAWFDYRNFSLLDVALHQLHGQDQVCFLNEHFRSRPELIQFSNDQFYESSLKLMRLSADETVLHHVAVEGKRDKKGVNKAEAEAVLTKVQELVNEDAGKTIGILSPFRSQAEFISDSLLKTLDTKKLEQHQLTCGTAYAFQGEERDVMLLSMALDDDAHHTAWRHLNRPDVFNVSVSRAKSKQYVFTSFQESGNSLIADYLGAEYIAPERTAIPKNDWKKELITHLNDTLEDSCEFGVDLAGVSFDAYFSRQQVGIVLLDEVSDLNLEDLLALQRAGTTCYPVSYVAWKLNNEQVLNGICKLLN